MAGLLRRWLAALAALSVLVLLSGVAQAYDEKTISSAERSAQLLQAQLRATQSTIQGLSEPTDDEIVRQRTKLSSLRAAATAGIEKVKTPLADITSQVSELGPTPASGQTEAPAIAEQRQELTAQMARLAAVQKQYTLLGLEAEQTESRLAGTQREQFLQRIFQSGRSVLDPRLWIETISSSGLLWDKISAQFRLGMAFARPNLNLTALWIFPVGLAVLWLLVSFGLPQIWRRTYLARLAPAASEGEAESGLLRLWRVLWGLVKLVVYLFAGLLLLAISLAAAGLVNQQLETLGDALVAAVEPAFIEGGLAWLVLSPTRKERRLVAVDGRAARSITLIVIFSALIYGIGGQTSTLAASYNLPVSFAVGQSAFTALALIVLLGLALVIVRRQAAANLADGEVPYFLTWFLQLLPLLWLLLAVAAVALIFGFIALSYFVVGNLLDTAMLLVFFGVLHAFFEAFATSLLDEQTQPGRIIRRMTGWSEAGIARLVLVFRTLADVVLSIAVILALVALWTVVLFNFGSVMSAASQGIKIGNFTLSPGTLAAALFLLGVGIFATRFVTRWLDRRVLSNTQLDAGVQNSLKAGAGYAGYILAAAIALSAAGVEFSNLAIVAGALGVGIGFGLQSIVNNFVSGLILLAERPVRVGDWVALPSGEGIVKKINVRSTEIETFDNCTIIVPNSNLITEPVRNWTHRDSVGRFTVNVSLTHGVKAEEAAQALLKLAQNHPKVMRHPAPTVHLSQITPTALVFDLRGHTKDVFDAANVASDLRLQVTQTFSKAQLQAPIAPAVPAPAR